uniref:Homeobox protein 2-like n=1 Tax=Strongyloides papillosus TaxID=174720 RepID=A0A0N5C5N2_STREA
MYRSKSLNYHYLTNDGRINNRFVDQTVFDYGTGEINPYSSVSILNNKQFYDMNIDQKYLSKKYDFQFKLIPRIKLSRRHKTFSKNGDSHFGQEINIQKSFQDMSNINISNNTFPDEYKGKVKFRDKKSNNFSENNFYTRFSVQNSINQNLNDADERRKQSVSQIISYFNEFSDKKKDYSRNDKKYDEKNFINKNQSLDENQNIFYTNSSKIDRKKLLNDCNIQDIVSTRSIFFKKNDNNYNGRKKEGIIYNNNDYSVTIKNINYIPNKCNTNITMDKKEHIYEKVSDDIISDDKISYKQHIPPFIRKFSVFPPDLTFKPRSFKSFFSKNTIY